MTFDETRHTAPAPGGLAEIKPAELAEEPDIERLWRLFPTLFAESETKREPALRYVHDSAKIVKITRINVDYKVQWWA